jgi:hypothetical protein
MSCIKVAILALSFAVPSLCGAQQPAFRAPSLADMRRDAVESVNISLGPLLLSFAGWVMNDGDPDSAAIKNLLRGLHRVQVHNYRYSMDRVYRQADLEALRSQLTTPAWHRLVRVRSGGPQNDVDVYYAQDNNTVTELVVLVAEPREFTLVNLSGRIDLKEVAALSARFVPHGSQDGAESANRIAANATPDL